VVFGRSAIILDQLLTDGSTRQTAAEGLPRAAIPKPYFPLAHPENDSREILMQSECNVSNLTDYPHSLVYLFQPHAFSGFSGLGGAFCCRRRIAVQLKMRAADANGR
jgi:hypothetical protein